MGYNLNGKQEKNPFKLYIQSKKLSIRKESSSH